MENLTAKVSCFARAYHYRNNSVHVFADAAAGKLLGPEYDLIAQSMSQGIGFFMPEFRGGAEEGLRLIVDRQLAPSVLGRSAFCERMLETEQRLGCRQYVVLAAGYDTFAIRRRNAALSVYELDRPELLADKKARIEQAGMRSKAVYVPCDLAGTSWQELLLKSGFKCSEKAFGSLLGISYYLGRDEFKRLIDGLGGIMCEGSAVCFDYPSMDDGRETKTNRVLAQGAGEEMKAQYTEYEMETLLSESGFLVYEHLNHEEMTDQYFADYNRSCPDLRMEAPKGVCYVHAVKMSK